MSRSLARFVAGNSNQLVEPVTDPSTVIPTAKQQHFGVVAVSQKGLGESYCLTVDTPTHGFCIENGAVVHNCVRYFIASRPPTATTVAQAQNPMSFNQVRLRVLKFHKKRKAA